MRANPGCCQTAASYQIESTAADESVRRALNRLRVIYCQRTRSDFPIPRRQAL